MGKNPVDAVKALRQVILATEKRKKGPDIGRFLEKRGDLSNTMAHEACHIAERIGADFMVVPTRSGGTARRVSRFRPSMPILALVREEKLRRRFTLYHGIQSFSIKNSIQYQNAFATIRSFLQREKIAKPGQILLLISGSPGLQVGKTGQIQIVQV